MRYHHSDSNTAHAALMTWKGGRGGMRKTRGKVKESKYIINFTKKKKKKKHTHSHMVQHDFAAFQTL